MRRLVLVLLLWLPCVAMAGEPVMDLSLPDAVTGLPFDLAGAPPKTTLLVFWQTDCEACLKELPVLAAFAVQNPDIRMIGVSLSDRKATRSVWQQQAMTFSTLLNDTFPQILLEHFGNDIGGVPYTVMLDQQRRICRKQLGAITEQWLRAGLAACHRQA